ncbi:MULTISPECIES: GntR family transcriptional regulator [unclassified Microbacterium]|uniref:GntR family transcriptional regulator n=1 Tax=unclassified Microbacterium TaxID=2609290 RepID=UPI0012F86091|nr:GntR family transcriptional regulator [Microbacterium sp. MAH-37]MVQ42870.1 FCD domain-containing protein [Microbacterium sp. MAH-37]
MGLGPGELESVRVTRVLREDIVLGRRLPGSRLVERDLARELNVSRLPVREAIRRLSQEGVVISRPRTWAVVRDFTAQDVVDLSVLRIAIENAALAIAAERHDEAGVAEVAAALADELDAAASGDIVRTNLAAGRFHRTLIALAGNQTIDETMGVFETRFRRAFGRNSDLYAHVDAHREIVDAFIARDAELVCELNRAHLEAACDEAVAMWGGVADPAD